MDAAPPPPAYVETVGINGWINCDLGYKELRKRLKAADRGKTVEHPDWAMGRFDYHERFLVSRPSSPLHPAILMLLVGDPSEHVMKTGYGGCGYGNPARFEQFLKDQGWDDSEIGRRQVTGEPWPDGGAFKPE